MTKQLVTMPRYEAYKNSGVEWIEDIPEQWRIFRFRYMFTFSKGLNITKENLQETGIPCVNYGEIHSQYGFEVDPYKHPLKCVDNKYLVSNPKSLLSVGDFVFADTSEDIEGSGNFTQLVRDETVFAGYHTVIARPIGGNVYRYLAYVIDSTSFRNQIRKSVKGVKVFSITKTILKDTCIWLPDHLEQTAIANFLDQKTTQINQAIAIKEKQITLLKERKQVLIQNAVTRGLNPDAPMRDSGVEWLGDAPAHWKTRRLKYIVKILKRIVGHEGPDVLSITQQGIKVKDIESGEGQLAMDYSKYQLLYQGEFAMNHMDLLTGYVDISKFDGVVSPDYRVFKNTSKEINDQYLLAIFQIGYKHRIFYRYGQGVSFLGRWRFPADNFNNFFIPIPPMEEQEHIVAHIEREFSKLDVAITLQQQQIEKLKEYKSTLINSAVTGKIKVA